eukprot:11939376-Karenia_brevis.AAC.1
MTILIFPLDSCWYGSSSTNEEDSFSVGEDVVLPADEDLDFQMDLATAMSLSAPGEKALARAGA